MHDVIIVGGGVIGLSIARELAGRGRSVLVLDRGNPRDATSWAAAGMLAPQSETDTPSPFFDLCLTSARLYQKWTKQLHEESGIDPEYADSGLLFVASTEDAMCRIRRNVEWQRSAGLTAELLSPEEALRLEPQLTLSLTGAVLIREECHVTPRRLIEALTGACAVKGVEIRSGVRVVGRAACRRPRRGRTNVNGAFFGRVRCDCFRREKPGDRGSLSRHSGHAAQGPDPLADLPPAEFHADDPVGARLYGAAPKWGACHWRHQ